MALRVKRQDEKISNYFLEKSAMCARLSFTPEQSVDCIMYGLPEEMRANAYAATCSSPEELFTKFLAGFDHDDTQGSKIIMGVGKTSESFNDVDRGIKRPSYAI